MDHADELADMTPSFNPYGGFQDWLGRLNATQLLELATDRCIRLDEAHNIREEQDRTIGHLRDDVKRLLVEVERLSVKLGIADGVASAMTAERDRLRGEVERLQHVVSQCPECSTELVALERAR